MDAMRRPKRNKDEAPELELNTYEEKVVQLIDYEVLFLKQQLALFKQGIQGQEWIMLPWTSYLCYFFTFAWETGRKIYLMKREGDLTGGQRMIYWIASQGHNFMKGLDKSEGFDNRFDREPKYWPDVYHNYIRRTDIQADFEYMVDAVASFFLHGLEKFIRKNPCLWGDMHKRHWTTPQGFLDLDAEGL